MSMNHFLQRAPGRSPVALLLPLSFAFLSGCYLTPNLGPPGTIGMQRSRAVLNDPFPNNDIAPPIVGGRPLGFDRPLAEPVQNQVNARNGGASVAPYQGF
jgi:hypothetical protein